MIYRLVDGERGGERGRGVELGEGGERGEERERETNRSNSNLTESFLCS